MLRWPNPQYPQTSALTGLRYTPTSLSPVTPLGFLRGHSQAARIKEATKPDKASRIRRKRGFSFGGQTSLGSLPELGCWRAAVCRRSAAPFVGAPRRVVELFGVELRELEERIAELEAARAAQRLMRLSVSAAQSQAGCGVNDASI